jgi:hypothetical protein
MSGDLFPVAGARIYIGGVIQTQSTDFAASDFSGETWTEIDGWETMGAIGDAAQEIKNSLINRKRDIKMKGTFDAGSMQNNFAILPTDAGQLALIAARATSHNYAFKIVYDDTPATRTATATVTIASPGVVTWTAHGLLVGDAVSFSTTGALPTGLTAATTYYVKSVLTADTFTLSATSGGSVINTTGTQSGVHTISTVPAATTHYFIALVMTTSETGGGANTTRMLSSTLAINGNIVNVPAIQ